MAIKDLNKKPFIVDRNDNTFIGIDLPFRKSDGSAGYFASTSTTIKAVKNNIKLLLLTQKGERLMQPNLGLNLRKYLFEQFTPDTEVAIQNDIFDTFSFWMPFVKLEDIKVSIGNSDSISNHTLNIFILFSITRDPNTTESIQLTIGE